MSTHDSVEEWLYMLTKQKNVNFWGNQLSYKESLLAPNMLQSKKKVADATRLKDNTFYYHPQKVFFLTITFNYLI